MGGSEPAVIIGYNTSRGDGLDNREGSHNLIIGDRKNYTAYSYGGMVVGSSNQIAAQYAPSAVDKAT